MCGSVFLPMNDICVCVFFFIVERNVKIFHHEKAFSQHLQYSYQWFDEEMLLKDDEEAKIKACVCFFFFLLSSLRRVQRSNESKVIPFMRYSFPYELVYVSQSRLQHFHLAQKNTHIHIRSMVMLCLSLHFCRLSGRERTSDMLENSRMLSINKFRTY